MTKHGPESNERLGSSLIEEFIGHSELEPGAERIDKPEDLIELERVFVATQFIKSQYRQPNLTPLERALAPLNQPMHAVSHIGNQFSAKIIPCFMEPNIENALSDLRKITPHTTDEELVLLIRDDQFNTMHAELHNHLAKEEEQIVQTALERLESEPDPSNPNKSQVTRNDKYQFNGNETRRSLENMLAVGVQIALNPESLPVVAEANEQADDGILPVTELVKNEEILVVNGFGGSKISLAVHDAVDHVWTFDLAERVGLFNKFSLLFNSVGNPQSTDLFKREGEMVASIAFGVRYWATMENGFKPLFDVNDLLKIMDGQFDTGALADRHMSAYKILRALAQQPYSRESQSLGFVFSNYMTELQEQRRKHGKIKQRDLHTNRIIGELDVSSPDYLSFFIELHHELLSARNKHRDDLLRNHILLEEYLCAIARGDVNTGEQLTVRVQDLKEVDFSRTILPPTRINWMARNYGFTAVRDAII